MTEHEFIEVDRRRWCLRCELFQRKRGSRWPAVDECPNNTHYARANPQPNPQAALDNLYRAVGVKR